MPAGIVLILMFQVGALALLARIGALSWAPSWVAVGFLTSIMMPMLALQMSLLREPWVSLEMQSAGPVILASAIVIALYLAYSVWVLWVGQRHPPSAAVLLTPPTLAIPAMIGQQGLLDQQAALLIISEVTLITAIAAAVVWLFPGWPQLISGAAAFGLELVRLWAGGSGPWRHETSGAVVSVIYITMLAVAVLAIVLVPMLAALASTPGSRRRIQRSLGRAAGA